LQGKEKVMPGKKTRNSVICPATFLTAIVVALTLFPISIVRANPAQNSAASAATFKTKCAVCHGPDGAGSDVGKSMNVPDLRSQVVQKLPDAELVQIISDGKAGMPSFKSSLSPTQIQGMVKYIRSLATKK
jgi:cytochrome c6